MVDSLSAGELSHKAAEVLGDIPFPALVLEVPAERIVAASPAATHLLDPLGGPVVGRLLEEFTSDRPTPGPDLLAGGRLNGFETFRVLRRRGETDLKVRMWIRRFDHQPTTEFVVVVIVADTPAGAAHRQSRWQDAPAVVGTADASLLIERISSDAEELFHLPVADLLGRSLLALIAQEDVPVCLTALSEASALQHGITIHVGVHTGTQASALRCEILILPLQPSPSCAFVFLPIPAGTAPDPVSATLSAILLRLGRGAEAAELARGVFRGMSERNIPGLSRLTTREFEVVTRLLEGDRAPAIASKLFLSKAPSETIWHQSSRSSASTPNKNSSTSSRPPIPRGSATISPHTNAGNFVYGAGLPEQPHGRPRCRGCRRPGRHRCGLRVLVGRRHRDWHRDNR